MKPALVLPLLGLFAALLLAGCGGSGSSTLQPASSAPRAPSNVTPAKPAMIVYRDGLGDLLALDTASGARYRNHTDGSKTTIITADCTGDGSRLAYLQDDLTVPKREIMIPGAKPATIDVPSQTQGVAWSPTADRIAYATADPHAGYQLHVITVAAGKDSTLAQMPGVGGPPRWSPDGQHLAFYVQNQSKSVVYVQDLKGGASSQPRVLAKSDLNLADPDWSPDGRTLLLSGMDAKQQSQLYQVNADGSDMKQVTSSDIFKRFARYSPDGKQIAFTGSIVVPAVSVVPAAMHTFGVFRMNSDGSDERALTDDPRLNPKVGVDPYLDALLIGWCLPGPWLDQSWVREK